MVGGSPHCSVSFPLSCFVTHCTFPRTKSLVVVDCGTVGPNAVRIVAIFFAIRAKKSTRNRQNTRKSFNFFANSKKCKLELDQSFTNSPPLLPRRRQQSHSHRTAATINMSAARAARKLKSSKNSANPIKRPQPTPATIQQHKLAQLDALAESLNRCTAQFVVPAQLSFLPNATPETLKLDYSPLNASTHAYEDLMMNLLLQYDRIESDGDEIVREQRKSGVKQVEAELERLDSIKRDAFVSSTAPSGQSLHRSRIPSISF